MKDYKELVSELRDADQANWKRLSLDAAAAIEDLEGFLAEAERDRDEYMERMEKEQKRVIELQARLGEAENSVERWKGMYLTKHEPKRGEFEKSLHEMFDSIWDCDINHPIFQDTVGELMEAVLQAYDTVNRAKMEVQG